MRQFPRHGPRLVACVGPWSHHAARTAARCTLVAKGAFPKKSTDLLICPKRSTCPKMSTCMRDNFTSTPSLPLQLPA
ncbi:hypothetical protein PR003_g17999, partial [Phytophthora rubi]